MILNSPIISGSLTVTGNIITSGSITISGSIASASYASNADLLDGLDSTVFTLTSSFNAQTASFTAFTASLNAFSASQNSFTASILAQTASLNSFSASVLTFTGSASTRLGALESYTSSLNAKTASFATTGSNIFIGTQTITGSVLQSGSFTSTGTLTAQTLVVQTITSSVVYSSGSNIFGNTIGNTQTFTGSVLVTGSLTISTGGNASAPTIFGSTIACSPIGCFATSCATSFIGGTMSGTTIYGSTAVCSPVGLFSGCVGIGTATPSYLLDIRSNVNSGTEAIRVTNTNTGSSAVAGIAIQASTAYGSLFATSNGYTTSGVLQANRVGFYTTNTFAIAVAVGEFIVSTGGTTERMRIDTSGNVGIGTAAPSSKLSVAGAISFTADYDATCPTSIFRENGNKLTLGGGTSGIQFNKSDMSVANVAFLDSGISCFRGLVCAQGGVKFGSGTGTLNYYEQGTWTPRLKNGSFTTNAGAGNAGWYTRIGNLVTVGGTLDWGAGSGAQDGNSLQIACLPFASSNTSNERNVGQFGAPAANSIGFNCTTKGQAVLVNDPGASYIYLIETFQNGTYLTYSHNLCAANAGTLYGFQITYHI